MTCPIYPKGQPPNPSRGYMVRVTISGKPVTLRVSEYEDGTPAEVHIEVGKAGIPTMALWRLHAESISLNLQMGVPLKHLVEQYTFTRFEPCGAVEGHPRIATCTSIADFVFRDLAITYLGREDLAHKEP